MRSRSLGFGLFCFLCGDIRLQLQSLGWVPVPTTTSTSQRPLRQKHHLRFEFHQKLSQRKSSFSANLSPDNNNNNNNSQDPQEPKRRPQKTLTSSFHTALCIIPPDEHWDTLQRARHFAEDRTYHEWPPAIRLFHPFCPRSKLSDVAFDLAKVVEKYNIKPFDITLDRWTVMPMPDTMAAMLESTETDTGDNYEDPTRQEDEEEYLRVQALIESESRISQERQRQRAISKRRKQERKRQEETGSLVFFSEDESSESPDNNNGNASTESEPPKNDPRKDAPVDEFNGPAMIALEPNERSSRRLKRLRELIRRELVEEYGLDASTSSTLWDAPVPLYDDHSVGEYAEDIATFRPLIPIGYYPTIDGAITVARKLKGLWDPLTFSVLDLHCISQAEYKSESEYSGETEHMYDPSSNSQAQLPLIPRPLPKTRASSSKPTTTTTKTMPFGCDALVMLMGEEIEMDNDVNEEMANFVLKTGTAGGYGRSQDDLSDITEDDDNSIGEEQTDLDTKGGDWSELTEWLDADDDEDELEDGIVMVLGRTYLFSGEKRSYLGMPASSSSEELVEGRFGLETFRNKIWPDEFEIPWGDAGLGLNKSSNFGGR